MIALIDQDIAHISRIMRPSLIGDLGGAILPSAYWRERLHRLLDSAYLTQYQLHAIDDLLIELNAFERQQAARDAGGLRHASRPAQAGRQPRASRA
jgi:hypothetical protein